MTYGYKPLSHNTVISTDSLDRFGSKNGQGCRPGYNAHSDESSPWIDWAILAITIVVLAYLNF